MNVLWTEPAIDDLTALREHIARDAEVYADAMISEILDATEKLEEFPRMGRVVPELGEPDTRELIIRSYRVIYEIEEDSVRILTVLHGARLLTVP
jgi:addiction module RelE/StbE family toxin